VRRDVRNEIVSAAAANRLYGVDLGGPTSEGEA
jgi:hypothetical protein